MTTHQLRTLRSAQNPCEAGPGGVLREFEVEHGRLFRQRVRMTAHSAHMLRSELAESHPEWFPVAIVEVNCD